MNCDELSSNYLSLPYQLRPYSGVRRNGDNVHLGAAHIIVNRAYQAYQFQWGSETLQLQEDASW